MAQNGGRYSKETAPRSEAMFDGVSHRTLRTTTPDCLQGASARDENNNNNQLNEDLICFVCREQYKNPKLLSCLHTFCKRCLESCVERGENGFQIKCPLCCTIKEINSNTFSKEEYLENLVSDFVVLNTLDSLAVSSLEGSEVMMCGNCALPAQGASRCSECAMFLCVNCQHTHRRTSATRNHNVCSLSLLDVQPNETLRRINYCRIHTGEALTYYCETCDRPVCNDCTFLDHPKATHALMSLPDVTPAQRQRLAELLLCVRQKLPFLKRTLLEIDSVLRALPDHADAVAREIARNTEKFIRALKQRQEQLLDDLTQLCLNKARVLNEQRFRIQSELDVLEANCRTTEKILRNGSDSEISSVNSLLSERMEFLSAMVTDIEADETAEFGYESDDKLLNEAILESGKVFITPPGIPLKILGDGLHDAAVGKIASFTLAKSKLCEISPGDIDVRIETPDSVILACDVKQEKSLYNVFYKPKVSGEHEISITVRGEHLPDSPVCVNVKKGHMAFGRKQLYCTTIGYRRSIPGCFDQVCDLAVRSNGHILAADSYNHRVQVLTSKGDFVSQFGRKGEDLGRLKLPVGLAISPEGHVIVTEHGNHRVQAFTSDGVYLWSFGSLGNTVGLMDHPTGVAVDEEGHLVVVDQHNHRVQVFSKTGCFKHQFGGYGNQEGQFDRPMYVAISQDGEIMVTDSGNHRIQVFDHDGRFRRAFGQQGTNDGEFFYPTGITIDACGQIIVSDKSNRIQVFSSELKFETKLELRDRGNGKLDCPMGLDYMPDGRIAVADKGNNNVKVLYV